MQAEYKSFADMLELPEGEAKDIARRRFPVPKIVRCDQRKSQARFLTSKLNPSATYTSNAAVDSGEVIMTDDVSLQVFTEHLKRLAVQS